MSSAVLVPESPRMLGAYCTGVGFLPCRPRYTGSSARLLACPVAGSESLPPLALFIALSRWQTVCTLSAHLVSSRSFTIPRCYITHGTV